MNNTYDSSKVYDGVVVLAGAVDTHWYLNNLGNDKSIYNSKNYFRFNSADERIYAGIYFLRSNKAEKIFHSRHIVSKKFGSTVYSVDASEIVKDFAVKNGISDERFIIYGDNVKRTLDEAVEFKKFLQNYDMQNILLVTSELHMRRAYKLFNAQGIILDRYSVELRDNFLTKTLNIKNFIPNQGGIKMTKNVLYELFGYIGYWLKGNL
tara:strand:- start:65 stop:688 length:624 start_codon:yes stop_codon:yes gene_type:complete